MNMKRFFSIFLLLLFLVYNAGYYLFYLTVNMQYDNAWKEKVEYNHLDQGTLITKSIPITFVYQADQKDFLPVLQSFEIDGKVYRVLQQRYAKDTLHIVYINDQVGKQMKNSLRDWICTLTQKPASNKTSAVWESLEKNYIPNNFNFALIAKANAVKIFRIFVSAGFNSPFIPTQTPPPKA